VFDDKSKTVFNKGRKHEEIGQLYEALFEGNLECYVEEEYLMIKKAGY
jgi:hypothetical protein